MVIANTSLEKHLELSLDHPPWGPGGLSRECVLRIPMRVVKGD